MKTCTNLGHPIGIPGVVVKQTAKAVYQDLVCPTCGLSQGVRRYTIIRRDQA